jgi:hypothetical protein
MTVEASHAGCALAYWLSVASRDDPVNRKIARRRDVLGDVWFIGGFEHHSKERIFGDDLPSRFDREMSKFDWLDIEQSRRHVHPSIPMRCPEAKALRSRIATEECVEVDAGFGCHGIDA